MIRVLPHDRQQIEQAGLDRVDPIREFRQPTARSESLCDSNEEYTTMLPLSPSAAQSDEMNSRRGSLASVARNS